MRRRRSQSRMRFAVGIGGLFALLWGCQYLLDPANRNDTASTSSAAPDRKTNFSSSVKVYLKTATNANVYIGEFDRGSCSSGFPQQWSIFMTSVLGQHRFDIDYSDVLNKKSGDLQIKVHPQRYSVKYDRIPPNLGAALLCEQKEESSISFAKDSAAAKEILQPLQLLAPDCNFEWTENHGLACNLAHPTEAEVLATLETLKKTMTTRWNHQPYLLIRRLTLTTQMLQALQKSSGVKSDLEKVCRIVRFSLPNELPLSFRSKLWQDKVCGGKSNDHDAALVALQAAAKEIQALSRRIEDASLVGLFTLSIPRDQSTAKEYLISLSPVETPYIVSDSPNQSLACVWHPLFFEQTENQLIALDLNLVQAKAGTTCTSAPGLVNAHRDANIYVRSSVASEMEFQIANGQSKQLRLPTGDYQYSVTQYNGPFPEELISPQEVAPVSSGQISWKNARPHLVIKSW